MLLWKHETLSELGKVHIEEITFELRFEGWEWRRREDLFCFRRRVELRMIWQEMIMKVSLLRRNIWNKALSSCHAVG